MKEIDPVSYALGNARGTGMILDRNNGKRFAFWVGTMEEYNDLPSLEADTFYFVIEPAWEPPE